MQKGLAASKPLGNRTSVGPSESPDHGLPKHLPQLDLQGDEGCVHMICLQQQYLFIRKFNDEYKTSQNFLNIPKPRRCL